MRTSSILAKLITLASIVGIVAAQRSPSTCTASGQCGSGDLGGTRANLPRTFCLSCATVIPVMDAHTTMNIPTGSLKSDPSSPLTGRNPTSTVASRGGATTKSGSSSSSRNSSSSSSGSGGSSGSTPTGGTSSGSGSGSGGSSDGTVAPAAITTAPGGSTGVAARSGGSVVAVVLLGSLVGFLESW
ncbi:hypothetical protein B9Z19DRAFT_1094484 [Tuber borchii]|uniref:Uncharacterized protein n=1 Tax=Tuber borchii TaxID=42251 RepID=A0A2T6ZEC0_TUBBO|nr:hypothetical protein B9Z19DRAFT_1094484 [Tuber borchii]